MSLSKVAVYVPSTQSVDIEIEAAEFSRRERIVRLFLSTVFGGTTSVPGVGSWVSAAGDLVEEKVTIITSLVLDSDALTANYERVIATVRQWAEEWGQEVILLEYGDTAEFIAP